ncbi:MAG: ABC transporter ATP-binding protein [Planctomycetota bacterium]
MSGLSVSGLSRRFGERWALRELAFELASGSRLAVLGRSGAGKTTLLRLLAGLEAPDAGRVLLEGRDLAGVSPAERGVGMVFQDLALWPHKDVEETLSWTARGTRAERRAAARRLADEVGLGGRLDALPAELSGGEQQRLAIARALAPAPRLLLCDEPFAHLDAPLRWELGGRLLELLAERGAALILVTHERREALDLADELLVLDAGEACDRGRVEDVLQRPAHATTASLLDLGAVLPAEVAGGKARCALGELELAWELEGADAVLVRPGELSLGAEGVAGRVRRRSTRPTTRGVEAVLEVELEGGARVRVEGAAEVGAEVHLRPPAKVVPLRR